MTDTFTPPAWIIGWSPAHPLPELNPPTVYKRPRPARGLRAPWPDWVKLDYEELEDNAQRVVYVYEHTTRGRAQRPEYYRYRKPVIVKRIWDADVEQMYSIPEKLLGKMRLDKLTVIVNNSYIMAAIGVGFGPHFGNEPEPDDDDWTTCCIGDLAGAPTSKVPSMPDMFETANIQEDYGNLAHYCCMVLLDEEDSEFDIGDFSHKSCRVYNEFDDHRGEATPITFFGITGYIDDDDDDPWEHESDSYDDDDGVFHV